MNLLKKTKELYNARKNLAFTIILLLLIIVPIITIYDQNIYLVSGVNNFFSNKEKQEIFSYLKEVQPIEDQFYGLVSENMQDNSADNYEENSASVKEYISTTDKLLTDLIDVKTSGQVLENKLLFSQEIKAIRNMLVEQEFWISYQDEVSLEKRKSYLNEYLMVSKLRRDSLKKIFDQYEVQYIDLGNRIKYKIR